MLDKDTTIVGEVLNIPSTVKEAKYFSEDKNKSKVIIDVINDAGGWLHTSFVAKTLMNTIKEHEYETLAHKDLHELTVLMTLMTPDTLPELSITQKFFRIVLDKLLIVDNFSPIIFFQDEVFKEDETIHGVYRVEIEANLIAEKYVQDIKYDDRGLISYHYNTGLIKKGTNELSQKFNHLRPFDIYELEFLTALYSSYNIK